MDRLKIEERMKTVSDLIDEREFDKALEEINKIDMTQAADIQRAILYNDKGYCLKQNGFYRDAEKCYLKSVEYHERCQMPDMEEYIYARNNLGVLYKFIGKYKEAELIYKELLKLTAKNFDENSDIYTVKLNNLGALYQLLGFYDKAELLFLKSMKIRKYINGTKSISYIRSINNLASLNKEMKNKDKSLLLYRDTINLMESVEFVSNVHYYRAKINYCSFLIDLNEFIEADKVLNEILSILEQEKKGETKEYSEFLKEYAHLMTKLNRFSSALEALNKAQEILIKKMGKETLLYADILTEKAILLNIIDRYDEAFEHLLEAVKIQNQLFVNTAFDYSESQAMDFLKKINRSYDLLLEQLVICFKEDKERIKEAYLNIIIRKSIILEMTIVQNHFLQRNTELNDSFYKEVFAKLNEKSYIEILGKLNRFDMLMDIYYSEELNRYVMFVVEPFLKVRLIDLGEASILNQLVAEYRNAVSESDLQRSTAISKELFDIFFSFMTVYPETLIISGTNQLSQLPFETLSTNNGTFLLEETFVKYIASIKDLSEKRTYSEKTITIVADPDFDYPQKEESSPYKRIPNTKREAAVIKKIMNEEWKIKHYLYDKDASDSKVQKALDSRILHISTHGEFIEENILRSNPLKDSGLVFAGINSLMDEEFELNEEELKEIEDGKLTAYDLTMIELKNTELIVLSACKSGLGHITDGNSVQGFQRAFLLAGAEKLIMTLLDIPDKASAELISLFYEFYAQSFDAERSLHRAKLKLIDKCYAELGHAAPWLWGGFVCLSKSL